MPIVIKFVSICTRTCTRKTSIQPVKDEKIPRSPLRLKMAAPTRVVLLACGSFNPITNMHLRMFGKFTYLWSVTEYLCYMFVLYFYGKCYCIQCVDTIAYHDHDDVFLCLHDNIHMHTYMHKSVQHGCKQRHCWLFSVASWHDTAGSKYEMSILELCFVPFQLCQISLT